MNEELLQQLAHLVASRTGARVDMLPRERIARALGPWVRRKTPAQVLDSVADPGSPASAALLEAASVGETYLFRNPEQFEYLASHWLPDWRAAHERPLRAWSAGTATGEEAYSLAATLRDQLQDRPWLVLGTDLSEGAVAAAAAGCYRAWSVRSMGPLLFPVVQPDGARFQVLPELREKTTFAAHNLLQPPPGRFDLILCRNVLMYFTAEAVQRVYHHLMAALEPDGLLVLGVMDVPLIPQGLRPAGPIELACFVRDDPRERRASPPLGAVRADAAPAPQGGDADLARLHLEALEHIERGKDRKAERLLFELRKRQPDYLPAILESALLNGRLGRAERACELMRELLHRAEPFSPELLVSGPEPLPVAFYRASAQAFLSRHPAFPKEELRDG